MQLLCICLHTSILLSDSWMVSCSKLWRRLSNVLLSSTRDSSLQTHPKLFMHSSDDFVRIPVMCLCYLRCSEKLSLNKIPQYIISLKFFWLVIMYRHVKINVSLHHLNNITIINFRVWMDAYPHIPVLTCVCEWERERALTVVVSCVWEWVLTTGYVIHQDSHSLDCELYSM